MPVVRRFPKMGNDNLRNALSRAGISADELAELIKVDPRTVRRWLNGQPPYPRHRVKIARALDLTEHDLWPEVTTSAGASTEHAVTGETIIGYAHAGHEAVATTTSLISSATMLDSSFAQHAARLEGARLVLLARSSGPRRSHLNCWMSAAAGALSVNVV